MFYFLKMSEKKFSNFLKGKCKEKCKLDTGVLVCFVAYQQHRLVCKQPKL